MAMDKQEIRIQQDIVLHYNNTYCLPAHPHRSLIAHIPNEGQQHLVSVGLLPGFSDLYIIHNTGATLHHIYIEVKTAMGTQRPSQIAFEARIKSMGLQYHVVRSLDEFKHIITNLPK